MHSAAPALRAPWLPAALLGALVAVGCEPRPTALDEAAGVARLEVTPPEVRLGPRDSVEFTAVAYTENGQVAEVDVTWDATGGVMGGARKSAGRHHGWFRNGKCGENTVTATAHPGDVSGTALARVDCPTDGDVSASKSTVSAAPATLTTSNGSSASTITVERFAPQDASGTADADGVRQFVVGTGGRSLYGFGNPEPNSEVRYNSKYGVVKFTLSSGGYAWEYIPVSGSFSDTGTGSCH